MTKKADFTDQNVIELHDMGMFQKDIASFLGVSEGTVSRRAKHLHLNWKCGRTAFRSDVKVTPWWISEIAMELIREEISMTEHNTP